MQPMIDGKRTCAMPSPISETYKRVRTLRECSLDTLQKLVEAKKIDHHHPLYIVTGSTTDDKQRIVEQILTVSVSDGVFRVIGSTPDANFCTVNGFNSQPGTPEVWKDQTVTRILAIYARQDSIPHPNAT